MPSTRSHRKMRRRGRPSTRSGRNGVKPPNSGIPEGLLARTSIFMSGRTPQIKNVTLRSVRSGPAPNAGAAGAEGRGGQRTSGNTVKRASLFWVAQCAGGRGPGKQTIASLCVRVGEHVRVFTNIAAAARITSRRIVSIRQKRSWTMITMQAHRSSGLKAAASLRSSARGLNCLISCSQNLRKSS